MAYHLPQDVWFVYRIDDKSIIIIDVYDMWQRLGALNDPEGFEVPIDHCFLTTTDVLNLETRVIKID